MSDQKKSEPKPDDLTKPTDSETIELTEEELKRLSGGFKYIPTSIKG